MAGRLRGEALDVKLLSTYRIYCPGFYQAEAGFLGKLFQLLRGHKVQH